MSTISAACLLAAAPRAPFQPAAVFEQNLGQFPRQVKWGARADGYNLMLTNDGARFLMTDSAPVVMKLGGGRQWSRFQASEPTGGITNYMLGDDPRLWHTGVRHFNRVRVPEVYEGIDLVFYIHSGSVEYDFLVAPGADAKQIQLSFEGVGNMQVDRASGDLVLTVAGGGRLRHVRPRVFQEKGGRKVEIAGAYRMIDAQTAAFTLAAHDTAR